MAEELKACPFCGSHDVEVQGKPAILDALDSVCCNECSADAPYPVWNTRAQIPSQGGEAVEVVAYLGDGGTLYPNKRSADKYLPVGRCAEPLMTVAQHHRIMAAATHPADQVADDLTMVKVSRELLEQATNFGRPDLMEIALGQLTALLAKSEGVKKP